MKGDYKMPIIDPMYLYLIEVLHNVDIINNLVFCVLSFFLVLLVITYITDDDVNRAVSEDKKSVVLFAMIFIISFAGVVLIPTRDAMYKILIAHYVTTDNLQAVNEMVKGNVQDYLNMLENTIRNLR